MSINMTGTFNANQYEPNQGMGIHPPMSKGPFTIVNTEIKENSSKTGGYFEVEFNTPMGNIRKGYNLWYKGENEAKTVEIAHGQLSALCRVTGRHQIDWSNQGSALRGGQGLMDVGYQKNEEPDPNFPNRKGYTEVKRVYDMAGNEPGKTGQAQPQVQPQAQQNAPMTQQPGGGWGQGGGQPQAAQQASNQPQGQAWQPQAGGAPAGGSPPWGNRT